MARCEQANFAYSCPLLFLAFRPVSTCLRTCFSIAHQGSLADMAITRTACGGRSACHTRAPYAVPGAPYRVYSLGGAGGCPILVLADP